MGVGVVSDESPFGELLRDLRRRAGLSQQSLAGIAGISVDAVAALERGRRRSPRAFTVRVLADALNLDEAGADALHRAAAGQPSMDAGRAWPPASTGPLVGRADDVARVIKMLQDGPERLVTLTGPGGIGKTRLALEVAATMRASFGGDVRWLPLESVADPADVPALVAKALDVKGTMGRDLLVAAAHQVADRPMVLLVDNCEHLAAASAAACAALLARTTRLRVLATSRERLQIAGEVVWPVVPLAVPASDCVPERLESYAASRLFLHHARRITPAFTVSTAEAPLLAGLCRRLDGVPLAVELAASRTDVMSIAEVSRALDDGLDVLRSGSRTAPNRHQTLLATLDWSFALLSSDEQQVLMRLAVFADGATLDAARAVCADDRIHGAAVVGLAESLAAKSLLVRRDRTGVSRLGLLTTVRRYAVDRLRAEGGLDAVEARHAAYFCDLAERADTGLTGEDQMDWLDAVDADAANVRHAIAYAAQADRAELALRIAGALWRWCYLRGHYAEGRSWFAAALAAGGECRRGIRAKALAGAGMLSFLQCEYGLARAQLEAGRALYREIGDPRGEAWTLQRLGAVAREEGRYDDSERLHLDSISVLEAAGEPELARRELVSLVFVQWIRGSFDAAVAAAPAALSAQQAAASGEGIAWGLLNLGAISLYRDDLPHAERLLGESLRRAEEVGFREGSAWALNLLGLVATRQGDLEGASDRLGESLARHRSLGDEWRTASVLEAIAAVAVRTGDTATAARLLGAAGAVRQRIGAPVPACELADHAITVGAARATLGAASFKTAQIVGAAIPLDRLVPAPLARPTRPSN